MNPDWPTTRMRIIQAFNGERPGATLEATLIELHDTNPKAITDSIDSVAASLKAGKINSGWAVLKKAAIAKAEHKTPALNRDRRIRNADQWLRNAGLMYDRWDEVHDELFGDHGRLKDVRTPNLEQRYHDAWNELRPTGVTVELDELTRARAWIAAHKRLTQSTAEATP